MDPLYIDRITEALVLIVVGMGGVFLSLTSLYLLMVVLMKIDSMFSKQPETAVQTPTGETRSEINPDLIPIISAAIYAVLEKKVIIKTIHFLDDRSDTSWSRIGRLNIIDSHNINKRR